MSASERPVRPTAALGRPRSAAAHEAMIDAAHRIVTDEGPGALTVQAICQMAGTSRATFYRRWSNAWQCFVESVDRFIMSPAIDDPTSDLLEALAISTVNMAQYLRETSTKARFGMFLLDPTSQPDMVDAGRKDIENRRTKILARIADDISGGRLTVLIDPAMLVNTLTGLAMNAAFLDRPLTRENVRALLSRLVVKTDGDRPQYVGHAQVVQADVNRAASRQ